MREILFRGKRTDNGEWVYGVPISYTNGTVVMCKELVRNQNVDPETVGQYTGKKDKNGKRIFEGDIVRQTFESIPREHWDGLYYGFVVGSVFTTGRGTFLKPSYWELYVNGDKVENFKPRVKQIASYRAEIIGNIHDNPELLAKEAKK